MNRRDVLFHPAFEDDLFEAAMHLEDEAGLGDNLIEDFEKTLAQVLENPAMFRVRTLGHRRANLARFSYSIRFALDGRTVRVLALPHHRRGGSYWLYRLSDFWSK